MGSENFFRLLSVALLGLIGLVALPDRHAEPVHGEAVQVVGIEEELRAALEVNQINAGNLKPFIIEEDSVLQAELDLLELDLVARNQSLQ